ncbi:MULTISPECIES: lasso peptide biosynthesis B2 protein [Sphingomonadaceae]|uniref:lasso peptide biosynthesis B2 protein n=1 Tax=Sphingomonadales TaxID=204457 RepID=UPI00097E5E64|nr:MULTISPECIES: lasso peptide biosynthesis B2 protein [Sphingomonadaceae]
MSYGLLGHRVVLLDLAADRYLLLGEAEAAVLAALAASEPPPSSTLVETLLARRLICAGRGAGIAPVDQPPPLISALEVDGGSGSISSWEAIASVARARLSLRFLGLARTVSRWRAFRALCARQSKGRDGLARDSEIAAAIARGFAEARIAVPTRRLCVPDSLALARCLWTRGIAADVYFGVQLDPLLAHSWVQSDNLVLSDPLNIAADYTPVFKL